jgi:hypothetical protein
MHFQAAWATSNRCMAGKKPAEGVENIRVEVASHDARRTHAFYKCSCNRRRPPASAIVSHSPDDSDQDVVRVDWAVDGLDKVEAELNAINLHEHAVRNTGNRDDKRSSEVLQDVSRCGRAEALQAIGPQEISPTSSMGNAEQKNPRLTAWASSFLPCESTRTVKET